MSNILKVSPNGTLRLRKLRGERGVVELKITEDLWHWCVWRSIPLDEAEKLFESQIVYHKD